MIELLRSRTNQQSNRQAYTFLVDDGVVESTLTYGELDQRARAIAARLQSIVEVGDRVLLLYPPGLEYIAAFFGCLYAGAIAVPAYPPRNNRNLHRLQRLVQNAEAAVSLTTSTILSRIEPHVSQNSYLAPLVWQATDQIPDWVANDWREPSISGDSLAFLQYTSGSTSTPKGVMVSHHNLLHNERLIQSVFQQTDQSVIVGWLPLYHDMGLIGNVIQPLFVGAPCILMSPMAFLQKPFRWLQAISRYRATTSGGPNFAYDLCVRKINDEQRATLDLSSWQVAFNGAEPVRQETLERFAAAFAPCGFEFDAFRPCYGLAEATLLVSGRTGNEPLVATTVQSGALQAGYAIRTTSAVDACTLVNCGGALAQDKVVIVDPKTLTECAPGAVGEIWVAGPGVAQGYWNDPAETDRIFRAYLPERGEGPFLRTEDLGFLLDGNLFVTGRLKDLIIIRGLNHYPQDIELTVERCHPALRPGCCAAFSVDAAGEEQLVIVQEVDQRRQFRAETVIESINEAVAREHELQAHAIALVTPGTVPKTSSGKIQRYACREAFLCGALEVVAEQRGIKDTPAKLEDDLATPDRHDRQAVELWLRAQIAGKLNVDLQQVDVSQPLTRYGLDSLAAIELAHQVESNLGLAVPLTAFLEGASIAELTTRVVEQQHGERRLPIGESIRETSAPLSVGQRALWFLQQVDPESAAYNLAGALRVLSQLDVPALQRAFQQLVKRHVSLRTTFPSHDGAPAVSVNEDAEVDFIVHDTSAWDDAAVGQYLTDEAHRPFDLEAGPLLRVRLLNRLLNHSGQDQVLLLCLHHIIADQWSLAVLLDELGVLYEAECTRALVTLPDLRSQYADYARWQEKLLSGESGERLLSYWKKQLAGELPNLKLPTDRPYPPVQTYHGAAHLFRLNAELTRSLKEISCAREATLYMTLLAAFQVLLHGYTDQEDILIGSPTAGRSLAEFANVVGYFVNPLVIRAGLTGNSTFEAVLSRTRQTVLEAFEHQDYPFPLLTERLQPTRDASRSPIFQVMFSMQNTPLGSGGGLTALAVGEPGAKLQLGELHLESLPLEQQTAMFDITLRMAEVEGELLASLQYNTDLFDLATIARMAEHFQSLLEGIVSEPSRPLSELPLLTRAESRQLAEWNKTDREYGQESLLHELFEQQVARTPEAVALVFEGERLSYAALNERANRVAGRLRHGGVKPETRVGLCVERSFELVLGLLGILKAGGAYVPLNPADPPERLAFMCEDAGAQVVLTQKRFGHLLAAKRAQVIYLDEPYAQTAGPMTGSSVEVCPENLAYVIYTSGSTGQPKGAMNEHKAVVNRLLWMQEVYGLGPSDSVLQKTPFTFDVSVWEFFWPLMVGARLVLARPGGHQEPAYLARLIEAEQVTTLHFVPSMLQVFLEEPAVRQCRSLKRVICSGEALPLALQERFFQMCDAELHNLYGPTEAAVDVTFWACERDSERRTVPIGRPIANTQIHLLDGH
ncbi:MAG TPA: AMP-binding protein, partial [Pyrinomonadaceae bacterium]|nr:AMP-binding protein [Pyrinomonadaceae bacterium]